MNLVDTPGDPEFLLPFQNILITLEKTLLLLQQIWNHCNSITIMEAEMVFVIHNDLNSLIICGYRHLSAVPIKNSVIQITGTPVPFYCLAQFCSGKNIESLLSAQVSTVKIYRYWFMINWTAIGYVWAQKNVDFW